MRRSWSSTPFAGRLTGRPHSTNGREAKPRFWVTLSRFSRTNSMASAWAQPALRNDQIAKILPYIKSYVFKMRCRHLVSPKPPAFLRRCSRHSSAFTEQKTAGGLRLTLVTPFTPLRGIKNRRREIAAFLIVSMLRHGRRLSLFSIEPQSSKLLVAGPIPVSRSIF